MKRTLSVLATAITGFILATLTGILLAIIVVEIMNATGV